MKSKRGSHNAVLASVIIVGIVGLFFVFSIPLGTGRATFAEMTPASSQSFSSSYVTGKFTAPAAKSYGGAIKGVSDSSARAFSGRAVESPDLTCYTCSCHNVPLSAPTRENAEVACMNNCGGKIVSETPGACR